MNLCKDAILLNIYRTIPDLVSRAMYFLLTAVGEELFFRNFLIGICDYKFRFQMIFISALCFVAVHVNSKWEGLKRKDFVIEIVFSLFSGFLFVLSDSCWPCITAHVIFNFPYALLELKTAYFLYREVGKNE